MLLFDGFGVIFGIGMLVVLMVLFIGLLGGGFLVDMVVQLMLVGWEVVVLLGDVVVKVVLFGGGGGGGVLLVLLGFVIGGVELVWFVGVGDIVGLGQGRVGGGVVLGGGGMGMLMGVVYQG